MEVWSFGLFNPVNSLFIKEFEPKNFGWYTNISMYYFSVITKLKKNVKGTDEVDILPFFHLWNTPLKHILNRNHKGVGILSKVWFASAITNPDET